MFVSPGGLRVFPGGLRLDPTNFKNNFDPTGIGGFKSQLMQINPEFLSADFGSNILRQRALGQDQSDIPFQRFAESQFNIFESGAAQQRQNTAENLARRGLLNSSVGLGALQNVDAQLAQQREGLGSQLGLQQLTRRDQALMDSARLKDLELSARTAGLENLLALPTLDVARLAAENAGKVPSDSGGGGRRGGLVGGFLGALGL